MKDQKKADQKPMTVSGAQAQFLKHQQDYQSREFKKKASLIHEAEYALWIVERRIPTFKDYPEAERMKKLEEAIMGFEHAAAFLDRVCIYLRK